MSGLVRERNAPETLLVSELATIDRIIDFVAARRHLRASDAADFASHVKTKLVENDYAILRKFQGRSSLRTYLTVVIQRMFVDYCVEKWGRWRPSAEAKRAGEVGIVLEQLLWRDGYTFEEACEIVLTNYQMKTDPAELERIAATLPARPRRRFDGEAALVDRAADTSGADALVERRDRTRFAERVSATLKRLIDRAEPQDRLILVLKYVDGRSLADIASMMNLDQKRLYRRHEHLLRDLRDGLEAEGIVAEDALAIFDDPGVSLDW
jgi:RNA polymerase sigma factor for flagellar operon FliA